MHDTFMWNWSKTSICDDTLFISSCINEAIANEIQWSIVKERVTFASGIWDLPWFIDGALVETCKLWNNVMHQTWFNGREKSIWWTTWSLLTTKGLFIYINIGYPRSYHDVNILWHSNLYANWRNHFTHMDEYFEHLLGYPSYMGEKMFYHVINWSAWVVSEYRLGHNESIQ